MRLPGIEYGPVQSQGREQVNRDYLATAAAKAAGVSKLIDTTGELAKSIDQRVTERQYQKAISHYAEKSAEVKLDLEEQQSFTAKYLRGEGLEVEGDDDVEYPAHEVSPYLYNKRMDEVRDEAAGMIHQGRARAKFIASRADRHERDKQIYSLEQMTRYRKAMTAELDSDNARLMAVGKHFDAIEKVEASSLTEEEKTKRIHDIHQDRQISEINWIKNDPEATVKDLKKLYTRVHAREFNHVTKGQRDLLLRQIKEEIARKKQDEKEALIVKEFRELVDRHWTPDADPVALDKILREKASSDEVLTRARNEVAFRNGKLKEQEAQKLDAAWQEVYDKKDPKVIDGLDVKPSEKVRMHGTLNKILSNKLVDDKLLVEQIRDLAAGEAVEIGGKKYEADDWPDFPIGDFRQKLSVKTYEELSGMRRAARADRNSPDITATTSWKQAVDDQFEYELHKKKTQWTVQDKAFLHDIRILLGNDLKAAELKKGSKLTGQEMRALVKSAMRDRRHSFRKHSMFGMKTKYGTTDIYQLSASGELDRIIEAFRKKNIPLNKVTTDMVFRAYNTHKKYTDEEAPKAEEKGGER